MLFATGGHGLRESGRPRGLWLRWPRAAVATGRMWGGGEIASTHSMLEKAPSPLLPCSGERVSGDCEVAEALRDDGQGVYSTYEAASRVSHDVSTERAAQRHQAPDPVGMPAPQSTSATARALDQASALPAGAPMEVVVALQEPAFDFHVLEQATDTEREEKVAGRAEQLKTGQEALKKQLTTLGGTVLSSQWLVNAVTARVPAGAVASIAGLPGVRAVYGPAVAHASAWYDGDDVRAAVRSAAFTAAGYQGETGGRVSSPSDNIKIALLEPDPLNVIHQGWLDYPGGPSRVVRDQYCAPSCSLTAGTTSGTHGTWVASAALGSIEQGQDPSYPGNHTLDQSRRSGIAPEAEIYYYHFDGCGVVNALQDAVAAGVDVVNWSGDIGCGGGVCETTYDCCGLNAALKNALDAGTVVVNAAGNFNDHSSACQLSYPAFRSETICASGVNAVQGTAWGSSAWTDWTSHGPFPIVLLDGSTHWTAGSDIAAPVCRDWLYDAGLFGYTSRCGTSISTPIVSGAAGLLRNALNAVGWSGNNARALMTNLMLSGDGSDGTAAGILNFTLSSKVGYGRLRLHRPYDLVGPWGWGHSC